MLKNNITDVLDLQMSGEEKRFGRIVTFNLIPNGRTCLFTEANKTEYAQKFIEYCKTKRVKQQSSALGEGVFDLQSKDLIFIFDESKLELLIGGIAEIDVEDKIAHTDYRSFSPSNEPVI
jgi:E3 ubiquitin-protein ligase NEDD4